MLIDLSEIQIKSSKEFKENKTDKIYVKYEKIIKSITWIWFLTPILIFKIIIKNTISFLMM